MSFISSTTTNSSLNSASVWNRLSPFFFRMHPVIQLGCMPSALLLLLFSVITPSPSLCLHHTVSGKFHMTFASPQTQEIARALAERVGMADGVELPITDGLLPQHLDLNFERVQSWRTFEPCVLPWTHSIWRCLQNVEGCAMAYWLWAFKNPEYIYIYIIIIIIWFWIWFFCLQAHEHLGSHRGYSFKPFLSSPLPS